MSDGDSVLLIEWSLITEKDKGVASLALRDDLKKSLACGFSLIVADSDSLLVLISMFKLKSRV